MSKVRLMQRKIKMWKGRSKKRDAQMIKQEKKKGKNSN